MRKHYLSLLSFATLLCTMLLCASSCKKDDGDDTPTQTGSDFFIEVDFLPKAETNGATAPRLIANFNDEAVMIELRPSPGTNTETVLFLCPDNEAIMMCGNDSLLVLASYDLATYTPSDDVLVVTRTNDLLLLTKCVMDWNLNTMTKGDMMALSIDDNSKGGGKKGDGGEEPLYVYNHLVKPLTNDIEHIQSFTGTGIFGIHASTVLTYVKTIISTNLPIILFSDDPEQYYESMEHTVAMEVAQTTQSGKLFFFLRDLREMGHRLYSDLAWALHGGHGKVNDYGGEETDDFSYTTFWGQSNNAIESAGTIGIHPPAYKVFLDMVSNVTENSAYLKGRFQFTSSITPTTMGYVYKVSGGPEQIVEDFNFNGKTITGLQKATKYQAYAYVENMDGRVISPEVTFWTLGFEVFPTSLTFPAEGGTKNVAVTYSLEDITYCEVTSNPSWCSFSIDDLGLLAVTVGETTETRSGTITITAHSNALGSITENITITQVGANGWDGTAWLFTGSLSTTPSNWYWTGPVEFTLLVNNVSNNNITFSFAQHLSSSANNYRENYVIDGNGNIIYTASGILMANGQYTVPFNCQITFVQTGQSSATADFYYDESHDGTIVTTTGLLQGTLTNAKETGDYKMTIPLNTPLFSMNVLQTN